MAETIDFEIVQGQAQGGFKQLLWISLLRVCFEACHTGDVFNLWKGRNMKLIMQGCFFTFIFFSAVAYSAKAPNLHREVDLKAELTGKNLNHMNDDQLYVEVLSQYQKSNRDEMKRAAQILLRKYEKSPHADNSLYLLGYSALEKKQFSESLRFFQKLLKSYPTSNKAVSSEFAKGVAYKHMKLKDLAQQSFMKVRKKYPGSPESFRAESELKLLLKR